MHYPFPVINHIDQILEAIHGRDEFKVIKDEQHGFTVINYKYTNHNTFSREHSNWELLRECRGIAFDTVTGKIISRPFQKFANYGEWSETQWSNIQGTQFRACPKYDGSMIRPIPIASGFVLATRGGYSEQAQMAQRFLTSDDVTFIRACINKGVTPIYEFIGPANPHVLRYDHNKLQLLAIRDNITGVYRADTGLMGSPIRFDLNYTEATQQLEGIEGFVLVTEDGQHRMKLKTEEYVALHRCKGLGTQEHRVFEVIFNDLWDDFYSTCLESERKEQLLTFYSSTIASLHSAIAEMDRVIRSSKWLSKKEFALKLKELGKIESEGPILFPVFEGKQDLHVATWEYARRNSTSLSGVEKMRWLIGNHNFIALNDEEVENGGEPEARLEALVAAEGK